MGAAALIRIFFILVIGIGFSQKAACQPEYHRVLVMENGQHELSVRIASELKTQGMEPAVIQSAMTNDRSSDFAETMDLHRAVAILEIMPNGNRIVVHVKGERVRPEIFSPPGSENTASLLAFKSVEMLRAMLLMKTFPEDGQPSSHPIAVAPTKAIPSPAASESIRLAGMGGVGVLYGFSQFSPAFQLEFGAVVQLSPSMHRLQFLIHGIFPTASSQLERPEGAVAAKTTSIGLRIIRPWMIKPIFQFRAGLGINYIFLNLKGHALAPFDSEQHVISTAAPEIAVGIASALGERVQLRLDLFGAWTLHKMVISVAGRHVDDWGRPLLGISGGIEIWFR